MSDRKEKRIEPAVTTPATARRSRLRRVTVWTAKGLGRAMWGGVKLLGRALWWSARAGWRAGRRFERRRRAKKTQAATDDAERR